MLSSCMVFIETSNDWRTVTDLILPSPRIYGFHCLILDEPCIVWWSMDGIEPLATWEVVYSHPTGPPILTCTLHYTLITTHGSGLVFQ